METLGQNQDNPQHKLGISSRLQVNTKEGLRESQYWLPYCERSEPICATLYVSIFPLFIKKGPHQIPFLEGNNFTESHRHHHHYCCCAFHIWLTLGKVVFFQKDIRQLVKTIFRREQKINPKKQIGIPFFEEKAPNVFILSNINRNTACSYPGWLYFRNYKPNLQTFKESSLLLAFSPQLLIHCPMISLWSLVT